MQGRDTGECRYSFLANHSERVSMHNSLIISLRFQRQNID